MKKLNSYIYILFIISFIFVALLYSKNKNIFPHKPHFEEDIKCKSCHPKAYKSTKARDNLLPEIKGCIEECHDKDILSSIKYAKSKPGYRLENNHEVHIEQDIKCTKCHEGLEKTKFVPGSAFPKMSLCFECHDNDTAPRTCTLCHIEKLQFPHKVHIQNDIECNGCHKKIATSSKTVRGKDIPDKKICSGDCHDAKDRYADVTIFDIDKPSPDYEIVFNHEIHIDQEMKCKECHGKIYTDKYKRGSAFPEIHVCFRCHDNETAERTCTLCHTSKVQFPHLIHIKNDMECDECHKTILESKTTTGGRDIPSRESCSDCHDKKDFYHSITKFPYKQKYYFNHNLHAKEQELDCKDCHSALYTKDKPAQSDIVPTMNMCFDCHDNSTATKYCVLCHINPTMPKDHYTNWDNLHKIKANNNLKECNDCHFGRDFCIKCHKGIRKPLNSHNPNFELTHKYEARTRLKNCKACHSERQCKNCHTARRVSKRSLFSSSPHPTGFVGNRRSPSFHGRKARLRLSTCTACHTRRDCYCHPGVGSFRKR